MNTKDRDLVEQMIQTAAEEANIEKEQSRKCVSAALQFIGQITHLRGQMDLSSIGVPGAFARAEPIEPIKKLLM